MGGDENSPNLESLIEEEDLGIDILHPGGFETAGRLAEMCEIEEGKKVLDVASGTGASAVFLADEYGCSAVGLDSSELVVERARERAEKRGNDVEFILGDAHGLPFRDGAFDVVVSECTLCLLDKEKALGEMVRVARPGGFVGIDDICWRSDTSEDLKSKLKELEGERPETADGWRELFKKTGLQEIEIDEKHEIMRDWMETMKDKMGISGQLKIFWKVLKKWGFAGLRNVRASQKIFEDDRTGYLIVAGRKPFR